MVNFSSFDLPWRGGFNSFSQTNALHELREFADVASTSHLREITAFAIFLVAVTKYLSETTSRSFCVLRLRISAIAEGNMCWGERLQLSWQEPEAAAPSESQGMAGPQSIPPFSLLN